MRWKEIKTTTTTYFNTVELPLLNKSLECLLQNLTQSQIKGGVWLLCSFIIIFTTDLITHICHTFYSSDLKSNNFCLESIPDGWSVSPLRIFKRTGSSLKADLSKNILHNGRTNIRRVPSKVIAQRWASIRYIGSVGSAKENTQHISLMSCDMCVSMCTCISKYQNSFLKIIFVLFWQEDPCCMTLHSAQLDT